MSSLSFNTWTSRSNSAFIRKSLGTQDIILAILSFVSLLVYSRLSKLGGYIGSIVKFPILIDLYMGTDVSGLCGYRKNFLGHSLILGSHDGSGELSRDVLGLFLIVAPGYQNFLYSGWHHSHIGHF